MSVPTSSVNSVEVTPYLSDEETEGLKKINVTILDGTFFKPKSAEGDSYIGTCVLCLPKIVEIKGYSSSSTNFVSHLQRRHGVESVNAYKEYAKNKKSKNVDGNISISAKKLKFEIPTLNQKTEKFNDSLVKFMIDTLSPLDIVENKYFKEMFSCLKTQNNSMYIFNQKMLESKIDQYYQQCEEKLRTICRNTTYMCTTCDIWSDKCKRFVVVTIHWIDEKFERKSLVLACRRFSNTESPEVVAQLLKDIYVKYGLPSNKVVATITDNISTVIYKETNSEPSCIGSLATPDSSDGEQDCEFETNLNISNISTYIENHISCFSYTLNVCVAIDGAKAIETTEKLCIFHKIALKKCKALWKASAKPKMDEVILTIVGQSLSCPIKSKWNSLYNSLKQIFDTKNISYQLFTALNLSDPLNEQDFHYISEYLECTKPFADLLEILQGKNNNFFGIFLPSIFSLNKKLELLSQRDLLHCKPLVIALKASIQERFSELFSLNTAISKKATVAAFSHPRFKKRWLQCVDTSYWPYLLNTFKEAVIMDSAETSKAVPEPANRTIDEDDAFFDFEDSKVTTDPFFDITRIELEISQFFDDPSRDLTSLEKYPDIKKIFYIFNTPLPSSTPIELLLSDITIRHLPKSNMQNDSLFEKRVVLKANMLSFENIFN